jgi:Uma2 family endonuclease
VDEYWVIDPRAETVTVFSRTAAAFDEGESGSGGLLRSRLFPDLAATVAQILAR